MIINYFANKLRTLRKKRSPAELKRILKNVLYLSSEEIILVKDLNELISFPLKNRLQIQNIEKKHLANLEALRKQAGNDGNPLRTLNEYFDNNCHGLIAKLNEEYIGYIWWGDSNMKTNFSNIISKYYIKEIRLSSSETYGFDYFIAPKYRGNGYAIEFFIKYLTVLRELGFERTFGIVVSDNIPARWIYKLAGYKEVRKIKVRRIFQFAVVRGNKLFFDKEVME